MSGAPAAGLRSTERAVTWLLEADDARAVGLLRARLLGGGGRGAVLLALVDARDHHRERRADEDDARRRLQIASLRHGTGGMTTSRGAVQTCSQTPDDLQDRRSALISGRFGHLTTRIHARGIYRTKGRPNRPLRANRARPYPRHVSDPERIHEHEKPRAPEHKPEPAEDAAGPLHEFVSNVGNRAFGGAIARTQGAGIMPSGEVHPSVQSTIDSTRGAGTTLDTGVARQALALARRPLRCPRTHRFDLARAQSRGLGARLRDRQRRLLRAERVQAQHVGRRRLIAHELAHVVQQRGAPTSGPLTVSNPGDAMENEADSVADKIAP